MLEIDVTLLILSYLDYCESIGVSLYKDPNYKSTFFPTYRQSQLRFVELALVILQVNKFSDHDFPELAGVVAKTATFADIQIFQYGLTDVNRLEGINHDGKDFSTIPSSVAVILVA